jgi:hypothetical protein
LRRILPSARRLLGLAGAAVLGTAAALTLTAAPASAHHTDITGTTTCDVQTGQWKIAWTLNNSEADKTAVISALRSDPEARFFMANGAEATDTIDMPKRGAGVVELSQRFPATTAGKTVSIKFNTRWNTGQQRTDEVGRVRVPNVDCAPAASFESTCEGVTVTLVNKAGVKETATFEVTGVDKPIEVKHGDTATVKVPGAKAGNGVQVNVTVGGGKKKALDAFPWTKPAGCAVPTPSTSSAPPALPVTGASVGLAAGGALALLALGGVLFMIARRRRVTFTA